MNLPGIGRLIVKSLKEDGLTIRYVSQKEFYKECLAKINLKKEDSKKFDGIYLYNHDLILINKEAFICPEYLLIHETIHAIRTPKKRLPRTFNEATVHRAMSSMIKKVSNKTHAPSVFYTIHLKKAKENIESWREEAVADCLSLFFCVEYGVNMRRSSIDTKRPTFFPLAIKDVYTESDKKKFIALVKKECLLTLEFILNKYTSKIFDKKLVTKNFKVFFEKEIEYCKKDIKSRLKKQKTQIA